MSKPFWKGTSYATNIHACHGYMEAQEERLQEVVGLIKDALWITECQCDEAYTSRHMHAPNTFCGELDELADWVKRYTGSEPVGQKK